MREVLLRRRYVPTTAWALITVGTLGLLGTVVLAVPGFVHASSTIVVNDCASETGSGGTIGIADAIATANANANAATAPDTITFICPAGTVIPIKSTLNLGYAGYPNDGAMIIDGGGNVTLDGGGSPSGVRVMNIQTGNPGVTLENITIADGYGSDGNGGGVQLQSGPLTVTNSTFADNTADGGSTGPGAGGAILVASDGSLAVSDSTFVGNSAIASGSGADGGAIEDYGTVTIADSTFTGNSAANGGAVDDEGNPLTITDSTIVGNTADGGGGISGPPFAMMTIGGTILAQNSGGNCYLLSPLDVGYNIESGTDCGFTGTGDQQNVSTAALNLATALGSNGGPTQTLALLDGSSAIDQIPPSATYPDPSGSGTLTFCGQPDQRGVTRPQGALAKCSIGAYEFAPQTTLNLSASSKAPTYGVPPTLTATVGLGSNGTGEGLPTCGTVTFALGATTLGSGTLSASAHTVSITPSATALPAGAQTISVSYTGETVAGGCTSAGDFAGSANTLGLTVADAPTSIVLSVSPASGVTTGQAVTLTATVDPAVTPTSGTVTFSNGSSTLGTASINSSGVATYTTGSLAAGTYTFSAKYGGTTNFAGSTSSSVTLTVRASTGLSGNGSPPANPITAQQPNTSGATGGKNSAQGTSNATGAQAPRQSKTAGGVVAQTSLGIPLWLVALLVVLCFGLITSGVVLLTRTRKLATR